MFHPFVRSVLFLILFVPCFALAQENDTKDRTGVYGNLGTIVLKTTELDHHVQAFGSLKSSSPKGLSNPLMLGYEVRYGITRHWSITLSVGRDSISETFQYENGDIVSMDWVFLEVGAGARFCLPIGRRLLLSAGGQLAFYTLDKGSLSFRQDSNGSTQIDYAGNTLATRSSAGMDFFLTRWLALGLEVGYRYSVMDMKNKQTSPWGIIRMDTSGAYGTAGLRIFW